MYDLPTRWEKICLDLIALQAMMNSLTFHPGSDADEEGEVTHVLSVALRQRQIPSRLRKFLCLKPGSSLSQMYWTQKTERGEGKRERGRVSVGTSRGRSCQAAHQGFEQITGVTIFVGDIACVIPFIATRGSSKQSYSQLYWISINEEVAVSAVSVCILNVYSSIFQTI